MAPDNAPARRPRPVRDQAGNGRTEPPGGHLTRNVRARTSPTVIKDPALRWYRRRYFLDPACAVPHAAGSFTPSGARRRSRAPGTRRARLAAWWEAVCEQEAARSRQRPWFPM